MFALLAVSCSHRSGTVFVYVAGSKLLSKICDNVCIVGSNIYPEI